MFRKTRIFFIFALVNFACCCHLDSGNFRKIDSLTAEQKKDFLLHAKASALVIVGELKSFDASWGAQSGALAIEKRPIVFRVEQVLKGDYREVTITTAEVLLTPGLWVEMSKTKPLMRLSPQFFCSGTKYVVMMDKLSIEGYTYFVHGSDYSIWLATPENVKNIRRLLDSANQTE